MVLAVAYQSKEAQAIKPVVRLFLEPVRLLQGQPGMSTCRVEVQTSQGA